jgi:hypothetical protein
MAYEMNDPVLSAREWLDGGGLPTDRTVIGITGIELSELDTDTADGEVSFRASYTLWLPGAFVEPAEGPPEALTLPRGIIYQDELRMVLQKGLWHIGDIRRKSPAD